MCGIAGLYHEKPDLNPVKAIDVERMCMAIHHRGPDHQGIQIWRNAAVGYRRLSILDLSEHGHQPMTNKSQSHWLVFNGEIYNFKELRDELRLLNYEFRSSSDTEVVLHAFDAWGLDMLSKLEGMYAMAIYEPQDHRLRLIRDPFGIKPLYYTRINGQLIFGSEIRSLLTLPAIEPRLNRRALKTYLTLGYVPQPSTMFDQIHKVPAGHVLDLKDGTSHITAHFDLSQLDKPINTGELDSELSASIGRSLVSDVPLGVFLSGGLDSSLIAHYSKQHNQQGLSTFSIGFAGHAHFDETEKSKHVANLLGTDHHALSLKEEAAEVLPKVVRALEEPIADPSIIPTFHLCAMTKGFVTVALSGDGGDELFGGYNRYIWEPRADGLAGGLAKRLAPFLLPLLEKFSTPHKTGLSNLVRRMQKFLRTSKLTKSERYLSWFALLPSSDVHSLLNSKDDETFDEPLDTFTGLMQKSSALSNLQRLQYVDIHTMLVDNLLLKADKIGMHHSLEVRVPLLNHGLAKKIFAIPDSQKVRGGQTKILQRSIVAKEIDKKIANQTKRGFEVPIGEWLRQDGRYIIDEYVRQSPLNNIVFDQTHVNSLIDQHLNNKRDVGLALFSLAVLGIWAREFEVTP